MKRNRFIMAFATLFAASAALGACSHKGSDASDASAEQQQPETVDLQEIQETETVTETIAAPEGAQAEAAPSEAASDKATPDKDGYTTTASGLKYKVIKKGKGAHPKATSVVKAKYTGRLEDGTVFDSTDLHGGQPIEFPLNRVIPGWTEGLQLMSPGAVYEFVIPSNLGYGPQGMPPVIPGNATLIFEVELVDFK